MTRKSILFFSCEPGGAEVLIPVIRLLEEQPDYAVTVLSYGLGAARFAGKGVSFIEIEPVQKDDPAVIDRFTPRMIITSATSLPERDMSEKHLWHNARRQGVATLAFLDQWQNYSVRFSGPGSGERLAYLPDHINCIDEIGEAEMVAEGFERERLVKFGQPYLSQLSGGSRQECRSYEGGQRGSRQECRSHEDGDQSRRSAAPGAMICNPVDRSVIEQRLGIEPGRPVALFASEAIAEHYGRSRGYDQFDALALFLALVEKSPLRPAPVVKLHPKDAEPRFLEILSGYRYLEPRLVGSELSPFECIELADAVYGMTSVMLIEAHLLGKPVFSLQPGLCVQDPLVLSRHGVIPRLETAAQAEQVTAQQSTTERGTADGSGKAECGIVIEECATAQHVGTAEQCGTAKEHGTAEQWAAQESGQASSLKLKVEFDEGAFLDFISRRLET